MPKGVHNNHCGGRKRTKLCTCTEKIQCQSCISIRYYNKHKQEILIRQMDRYYENKGRDNPNFNEKEFEKKLIEKFVREEWD